MTLSLSLGFPGKKVFWPVLMIRIRIPVLSTYGSFEIMVVHILRGFIGQLLKFSYQKILKVKIRIHINMIYTVFFQEFRIWVENLKLSDMIKLHNLVYRYLIMKNEEIKTSKVIIFSYFNIIDPIIFFKFDFRFKFGCSH